jgi:hypothetical protein
MSRTRVEKRSPEEVHKDTVTRVVCQTKSVEELREITLFRAVYFTSAANTSESIICKDALGSSGRCVPVVAVKEDIHDFVERKRCRTAFHCKRGRCEH